MDLSFLEKITEFLNQSGKFLFETYPGIAILIGSCLLITLIVAVILEFKTRKLFKDQSTEAGEKDAE